MYMLLLIEIIKFYVLYSKHQLSGEFPYLTAVEANSHHLPSVGAPSCLHTVAAAEAFQSSLAQTVPHLPSSSTSTRPSNRVRPPTSRIVAGPSESQTDKSLKDTTSFCFK